MIRKILALCGESHFTTLSRHLDDPAVEVSRVANREGLAAHATALDPDVLVFDLVSFDVQGLAAYRWYRDQSGLRPMPCLFLVSSLEDDSLRFETRETPYDRVLIPMDAGRLQAAAAALLGEAKKLRRAHVETLSSGTTSPDWKGALAAEPPALAAPLSFAGKRITVVEDNDRHSALMCAVLESAGFKTTSCPNLDALKSAILAPPDLMILDVQMPHLDGIELAELLRTCKSTRRIPLMFVTAVDDDRSLDQARAQEPVAILTKPVRGSELLHKIHEIFSLLHHRDAGRGVLRP